MALLTPGAEMDEPRALAGSTGWFVSHDFCRQTRQRGEEEGGDYCVHHKAHDCQGQDNQPFPLDGPIEGAFGVVWLKINEVMVALGSGRDDDALLHEAWTHIGGMRRGSLVCSESSVERRASSVVTDLHGLGCSLDSSLALSAA